MVKRIMNKLNNAHSKYEGVIGSVESEIVDKVEFDFSIFYQPSDGFVMLEYSKSNNAPLDACLAIIKEKGVLSLEDYEFETI